MLKCKLIEAGISRPHKWKKYKVEATYFVEGNRIETTWPVYAISVFEVDRWANVMIENIAGSLTGAKKKIFKDD